MIVIALGIALIPAVSYRVSISKPFYPYKEQGVQVCNNEFVRNGIVNVTDPAFQRCLAQYLIPPINVTGYGSLSYKFLGLGVQPFPAMFTVGESDFYAVLHLSGARVAAAEEVPQKDVIYDPPGIVVSNSSLSQGFVSYDNNLTVTVTNHSGKTLSNLTVFFSVPGSDGNYTDNGITWIIGAISSAEGGCLVNGQLRNLTSGASCTETFHPFISTSLRSSYKYSVEVRGYLGSQFSITRQTFTYAISAQALNKLWVNTFVSLVDAARNNSALVESPLLVKFAGLRFNTAVTQPDISDYGLQADEASFFGANGTSPALVEILLYPSIATADPYSYANAIRTSAPGHWTALTDRSYTHFGYYVGSGPYELVQQPCPISEIPRAGVNITQFFENAGCKVSTQESTWLVIILSS